MKMVGLVRTRSKADWAVCGVKIGLHVLSLSMANEAVTAFQQDLTGEGLVHLGFALVYFLLASTDLRKVWDSRHMNVMCAVRATPASVGSAISTWIAYICIISGVILQHSA